MLPCMSIDLFYGLSLFLVTSKKSSTPMRSDCSWQPWFRCWAFFIYPLQFKYTRPPVEGFNGVLPNLLAGFDKPFNQAPSLRISLLIRLWAHYARRCRQDLIFPTSRLGCRDGGADFFGGERRRRRLACTGPRTQCCSCRSLAAEKPPGRFRFRCRRRGKKSMPACTDFGHRRTIIGEVVAWTVTSVNGRPSSRSC